MKNTLQTLDRGLLTLDLISKSKKGLTVSEIAQELAISRTIVYRLVTTLENHGLIVRMASGQIRLGAAAILLSHRFQPQLRSIAKPLLEALAQDTAATAFISIAQGQDCYVIMVEEPDNYLLRVSYRVGSLHPIDKGAAGVAILSARPESKEDSATIKLARQQGYSLTQGEIQQGAVGVSSPIITAHPEIFPEACVGVVAMEGLNQEKAIQAVMTCAQTIAAKLDS